MVTKTLSGKSKKTHFCPHFLTKTLQPSHDIPEKVVKITMLNKPMFAIRMLVCEPTRVALVSKKASCWAVSNIL